MPTILLRRNTSVQWAALNPILLSGEQGYEIDTGKCKIGNGQSRWLTLEYYLPESDVVALIEDALIRDSDVGTIPLNITEHINSSTPHPIYDDGPSLFLLYQNAKV